MDIKLVIVIFHKKSMTPTDFEVISQTRLSKILSALYLENALFDWHQTWYTGTF